MAVATAGNMRTYYRGPFPRQQSARTFLSGNKVMSNCIHFIMDSFLNYIYAALTPKTH